MPNPVTIIGGGLAGLTLGIGLRQRDVPVILHEANDYPRHRVCGEFISGGGQIVLEHLDLLPDFQRAGAVYARTAMFVNGRTTSPTRQLPSPALCLSRHKMDSLLAETFRKLGGELHLCSRWTSRDLGEGIVYASGRRLQSTYKESRWFGLKAHVPDSSPVKLQADLEMHLSPDGYVGISRINDGQLNVCGLFKARADNRRLESKTEWLRGPQASLLRERLNAAQFEPDSFCSVAGIQLKPQRALKKNECCVGDALTMTPPVTGNGMSMAFESAEIAIEPLTAYSRGKVNWAQTQQRIALQCDKAFSRRLAWARILQWAMVSPVVQRGFGQILLRSSWLWELMFARTR
jgi:2-polyprenyl-6-methoxyphenol hydroxylase-like FAD-dependent oxidoreductase